MIIKQFKIYPDEHWAYYEVFIHHNKRAMQKAADQPKGVLGCCKSWTIIHVQPKGSRKKDYLKPSLGAIHVTDGWTGRWLGIFSHELCHAAFGYFATRKELGIGIGLRGYKQEAGLCNAEEEAFCWILGNMMRQFCLNFHGKRQYKPGRQTRMRPIRKGDWKE